MPDDCLRNPDVCLEDEQYVSLTTPLTIKGLDSGNTTLWDMGFATKRLMVAANLTFENLRLQGFVKDVTPNVFFFIFHKDAQLLCINCWIEDACNGGKDDHLEWLKVATLLLLEFKSNFSRHACLCTTRSFLAHGAKLAIPC